MKPILGITAIGTAHAHDALYEVSGLPTGPVLVRVLESRNVLHDRAMRVLGTVRMAPGRNLPAVKRLVKEYHKGHFPKIPFHWASFEAYIPRMFDAWQPERLPAIWSPPCADSTT